MTEFIDKETGEVVSLQGEVADKQAKLTEWYAALQAAAAAKLVIEKEQALRKEVASLFFPEPEEGTNTLEMTGGYKLKLTHKLDRKLDEAALPVVLEQLRTMEINPGPLIDYKPTLALKAYKSLVIINKEAGKVFDQCLTVKPASPTLEIVAPKTKEY